MGVIANRDVVDLVDLGDGVKELAAKNNAELFYIVLTASEDAIEKRIRNRGDLDMIERAKF